MGHSIGEHYRGYKGDARSLNHSSYDYNPPAEAPKTNFGGRGVKALLRDMAG